MGGPGLRGAMLVGGALLLQASVSGAAGPRVDVDVSKQVATQAEVGIAVDPSNPQILVAGANDAFSFGMPSYTSTDGGASWRHDDASAPPGHDVEGDPALAIGPDGREYYAFLTSRGYDDKQARPIAVRVHVATRAGPTSPWRTPLLPASRTRAGWEDKPAITVDLSPASPHYGRVYLAWVRWIGGPTIRVVVNHSDDGGRSWSAPVAASPASETYAFFPTVAVGPTGDVYAAWIANLDEIRVVRSADGGGTFRSERLVDESIALPTGPCQHGLGIVITAQPLRCVPPAPTLVVDRSGGAYAGRVYLTYGVAGSSGKEQNVYVAAFDPALAPLLGGKGQRVQVNPPDGTRPSDQFLPVSALDQGTGRLWTCYYDTTSDSRRRKTFFSCSTSADGGTVWTAPVRAASVSSDMTQRGASNFEYGDYEGVAAAGGVAHPIWTDSRDLKTRGAEIYTTSIAESDLAQS